MTYGKKGMLDESITAYTKVIAIDPHHAQAHNNLGKSYLSRGSNEPAAEHLYKARLLFLKNGSKDWAGKAYNFLKQTNAKEREKILHEKLYPDVQRQEKEETGK